MVQRTVKSAVSSRRLKRSTKMEGSPFPPSTTMSRFPQPFKSSVSHWQVRS